MNEKLIVKDFGPIKNAELDLKKVTVFIGPQGSGKSALAKLVAICKDSDFLTDKYLDTSSNTSFTKYGIQYFLDNSEFEFKNKDYKYSLKFPYNSKLLPLNIIPKRFFVGVNPPFSNFVSYNNFYFNVRYKKAIPFDNADIIPLKKYIASIANSHIKYIPTERFFISSISDSILGLLSAEVALQKSTIEFGRGFEISRSNIPTLFIDYLNITYKYENGRNLVFHNETDSMPLSASASGHQSTIPLHLTVEHFSKDGNTHFIVEEPELNLFPTTQNKLVGYLADKCTQNGNELLMTTHSPYILSSLNILLFAYQVANKYPESAEEVEKIVPREQWLNPNDFAAYYVGEDEHGKKGGVHSIFNRNKQTQLIGENELDGISDELGDEFNELMNIYRTKKRETVD
jgi:predicted ATPase